MTSMNPVYRVGSQIAEAITTHEDTSTRDAKRRAVELLKQVGIPNPERRVDDYPHQFSGGMRQRAMIAMALANNPDVLIADEPTTALDVTIQAQIIELIDRLKDDFDSAVILITHDLGVVAEVADEIIVMYAGRVVEHGGEAAPSSTIRSIPYTWGLLGSIPRLDRPRPEKLASIKGSPPSLINPPPGCKFRPRCPHAFAKCHEEPAAREPRGGPGPSRPLLAERRAEARPARGHDPRRGGRVSSFEQEQNGDRPLLEVRIGQEVLPDQERPAPARDRARARGRRRHARRSARARRSASSASPAAASRRSGAASSGCSSRRTATSCSRGARSRS